MGTQTNDLLYTKKNVYKEKANDKLKQAIDYAEGYKKYLDAAKTEREAVTESIAMAEKEGYKPFTFGTKVKQGDKYYYNNRNKNLFLFAVGSEPIENGIRITAAHIDSPRLDLKPCPLYEESGISYLKTHYYGGIRKYQWLTIPLALHGVVSKPDGTNVTVKIGDDENDPVFFINDLLPHLSHGDDAKPLSQAFSGEKLNAVAGSFPAEDDGADQPVKLQTIKLLNERFGMTEEDFISSELCFVPAAKARDVGLDRSMIGGYGHDDRVCAYPALTALLDAKAPKHTLMCILADKEEIGSVGATGMRCDVILDLIDAIARSLGADPALVRSNSCCISSDVAAEYDPDYAEVFEKRNSSMLNCGVTVCKYTGARGKSGSNDAPAEFVAFIRHIMELGNVTWQMAELGKVDAGGGGTVAMFLAEHNISTIDIGVGVLAMHAPYELISKADLYEAYKAFSAFNQF